MSRDAKFLPSPEWYKGYELKYKESDDRWYAYQKGAYIMSDKSKAHLKTFLNDLEK